MDDATKKYYFTYEESDEAGAGPKDLLNRILEDDQLPSLKAVIIGYWGECYDMSPQEIIDGIIEHKDQFAHIESLYIGDMDYEECEVSWIIQGNYSRLFAALPGLKELKIKGAQDLVLGSGIRHENLERIEIICGGLGLNVIRDIANADLPSLKSLVLYLGVDNYGLDAGIEDIRGLIDQAHFPALTHLGLDNSEMQDELAEMIVGSDILPQLETLELSFGVMTDKGGQVLLDHAGKLSGLKHLHINYHYMTSAMVKKLEDLPFEVLIEDRQDSDDDYKYPVLTE
ncbi:MAG: STM4015 family protein [Lachnospiraceae bacterium]